MPVYGIMQELDNYIDSKRNRHPLMPIEKEWIFEHKQMWEHKEVKRLSIQLNNPNSRSIEVSSNDKKIEYFSEENLIIKGSGSIEDPFDIAEDDTDIYSDDDNPKSKKIAN
jgi:hypothetical protein